MTIETKYNIGDEVWVKDDKGKIRHSIIHAIQYGIWDDYYGAEVDLGYCLEFPIGERSWYGENECFPTKEELLKSL